MPLVHAAPTPETAIAVGLGGRGRSPATGLPCPSRSRNVRPRCTPSFPVPMPAPRRRTLAACVAMALALAAPAASVLAEESGVPAATELDAVLVVAQRASRASTGATNLDLEIKETRQSIRVVTAEQMHLFGADSVNEALRLATGVQVDEWETNRTSYSSRGFDILNTQIDGVGMPNSWGIATGAFDTAGYEKVEVIRG